MESDQYFFEISLAYSQNILTDLFEERIILTEDIINHTASTTGLSFILAKGSEGNVCMANVKEVRPEFRHDFSPIEVLDYLFAVLHLSNYQRLEKQFQETNFIYPKNAASFWELSLLGSKIKKIHSLQNLNIENFINEFNILEDCIVKNPHYMNPSLMQRKYNRIYINEKQYFENIPDDVWNFQTGTNHPARKWLNDRVGKKLNCEDIIYYQKIIAALSKIHKLVKEINKIME